jgi:2-polyprenyl-6-methoxyphenol hydroxylase-like FAD-dependent oxidoreductase
VVIVGAGVAGPTLALALTSGSRAALALPV